MSTPMFRLYTMTPDYTLSGWQWKDNSNQWHDYPKAVSDEIDQDSGSGVFWTDPSNGFTYIIYKKTLTQTNPYRDWEKWDIRNNLSASGANKKRSGGSSHLVSSPSASGAGASKHNWQWQDEFGQWNDYSPSIQAQIPPHGRINLQIGRYTYEINTNSLLQTNQTTFAQRPIRDANAPSSASSSGGSASSSGGSRKKPRTKRGPTGPTGEDLSGNFTFVYTNNANWAAITNWRRVYPGAANPSDRAFKDGWSFKADDDIPEEYLEYGLGLEPGEKGAPDFAADPDWSADDYDYGALVELKCSTVAKPCIFHQRFISRTLDSRSTCPSCSQKYNSPGPQPSGSLNIRWIRTSCSGYDSVGTWELRFDIPSGTQETRHQNPGLRYDGTIRIAYYPDVPEGRDAVRLIQYAFEKGFFFKIGLSVTTGLDDQTTWGGIHVKTSMDAPSVKHGWDGVTADKVLVNVYSEFLKVFNKLPQDLVKILENKLIKSLV